MRHNPKFFRCTTIIHLHYLRLLIQHCFEYLLICDCHIKKVSFRNFSLVSFPPLPENQLPFLGHLFEHQFIWVLFPESYNTAILLVQSFQVRSTYAELLVIPIFRMLTIATSSYRSKHSLTGSILKLQATSLI